MFSYITTVIIILRGDKMEIELNELLINSYDRNKKKLILIYDDNGNCETYTLSNIPERIKQMKVERYDIVSGKLAVIKVRGNRNEK